MYLDSNIMSHLADWGNYFFKNGADDDFLTFVQEKNLEHLMKDFGCMSHLFSHLISNAYGWLEFVVSQQTYEELALRKKNREQTMMYFFDMLHSHTDSVLKQRSKTEIKKAYELSKRADNEIPENGMFSKKIELLF